MPKVDITVRELADKALHSDLILPEMQRKYVWPSTRVRDLLDSLYRGYPSGAILVWETDEDVETRSLAVSATQQPTTSRKLMLLDGQQRITSLTAILSGQPVTVKNRKHPIEILFNLEHPEGSPTEALEAGEDDYSPLIEEEEDTETARRDIQEELKKRAFIVSSKVLAAQNPHWLSVSDIFTKTDKDLLRPLGINSDDDKWDKYSDRLQKVRKIADYPYVMQVLEKGMSYEEVTEIFVRVNSLGIQLKSSDLALAQITSKWSGFMRMLEDFSEEFKDDSSYILETGIALRALVVFASKQSKFRAVAGLSLDELQRSWNEAKLGLHFAINFVRSNVGVDNLQYMSSPFLLLALAVYWKMNDEQVTPDDEKKLLRWFYLAHMRGHYGMGSSETYLNADLNILFRQNSIDKLLEQLEQHVRKFKVDSADISGKTTRSPFFTTIYLIMKSNGAKDWFTGLQLSDKHTGSAHTIEYHHIFPKAVLQGAGVDTKEINEIANMAFIGGKTNRKITNKLPSEYVPKMIIEKFGEDGLASQLVPTQKEMWELDKYPAFLQQRRAALADMINKFMDDFS